MPDLWSHRCDNAEFENAQLKLEIKRLQFMIKNGLGSNR